MTNAERRRAIAVIIFVKLFAWAAIWFLTVG